MIVMLVNVEKVSFKNADNIVYKSCYYQISVRQQIFYDQLQLLRKCQKDLYSNTVRNHLFGLRGSQSTQWLTIKDRPWILLRTAYHLIALPTAHPPPEDPQFTGDAIGSPPNTTVGTSDYKLKLETDEGLNTTVSASNRE